VPVARHEGKKNEMRILRSVVLALVAVGCGCSTALASIITLDYNFSASGFVDVNGASVPPVDPVIGHFSVTFDNSADISETVTGLTFTSNLSLDSPVGFIYKKGEDRIFIGLVPAGTNDFVLQVAQVSTQPTFAVLEYRRDDTSSAFVSSTGRLTPVPEPATLSLLGLGFGGAAWRRRRTHRRPA
jgi:hypothetical protein